jgi:hypothetical protein
MNNASFYVVAWSDYRRRCRWFLGVWFGGLLVAALFGTLATFINAIPANGPVFIALAVSWWLALMILAFRIFLFRCPRCNLFASFTNPLAKKCSDCGLPKWSGVEQHQPDVLTAHSFSMTAEAAEYVRYHLRNVISAGDEPALIRADRQGDILGDRGEKIRWWFKGENFMIGGYDSHQGPEKPDTVDIDLLGYRVSTTLDALSRLAGKKLRMQPVVTRAAWFFKVLRPVLVAT